MLKRGRNHSVSPSFAGKYTYCQENVSVPSRSFRQKKTMQPEASIHGKSSTAEAAPVPTGFPPPCGGSGTAGVEGRFDGWAAVSVKVTVTVSSFVKPGVVRSPSLICPASSAVPSKTLAARKPSSGLNRMISGSFSFTTIFLLSVTAKALSARSTEILPPPVTRNVIPYCFGTAMVKSVEKSAARAAPINRTRDTAHAMARNARFMLIYPKRRRAAPLSLLLDGKPRRLRQRFIYPPERCCS